MKTVVVFLVLALTAWNAKAALDVEKPVTSGENYQHQLVCTAQTPAGEIFNLTAKWKTKVTPTGRAPIITHAFEYAVVNSLSGQIWSGNYRDSFGEYVQISDDEILKLHGQFFMYKRLGTLSDSATLLFAKQNAAYQLQKIVLTSKETFGDPVFDCNPYSKLCNDSGALGPDETILHLEFSDSNCVYDAP